MCRLWAVFHDGPDFREAADKSDVATEDAALDAVQSARAMVEAAGSDWSATAVWPGFWARHRFGTRGGLSCDIGSAWPTGTVIYRTCPARVAAHG